MAEKLSSDDKAAVEKAVEDVVQWLDANQLAEEDEFKFKREELEKTVSPIMSKMYQGGAGGMPGMSGMPDMGGASGPSAQARTGPTVEVSTYLQILDRGYAMYKF